MALWASIVFACITFITLMVTNANSSSIISSKVMNWHSLVFFKELSFSAHLVIFLKKFLFIVDLQCSINFCCTAKLPSHTHTHTYSFSHIVFYHILSQVIGCSSLCYTAGTHCLSILNIIVCFY